VLLAGEARGEGEQEELEEEEVVVVVVVAEPKDDEGQGGLPELSAAQMSGSTRAT